MARLDPRRSKIHRSYYVAEVADLFGVHRNTVRNWIKAGLPALKHGRQNLILGRHLQAFLSERQAERRQTCGPGELFCLRCRRPRRPREGTLRAPAGTGSPVNVTARCATCDARVFRSVRRSELAAAGFACLIGQAGGEAHSRQAATLPQLSSKKETQ